MIGIGKRFKIKQMMMTYQGNSGEKKKKDRHSLEKGTITPQGKCQKQNQKGQERKRDTRKGG